MPVSVSNGLGIGLRSGSPSTNPGHLASWAMYWVYLHLADVLIEADA